MDVVEIVVGSLEDNEDEEFELKVVTSEISDKLSSRSRSPKNNKAMSEEGSSNWNKSFSYGVSK